MTELQTSIDKAADSYFIERAENSVKELLVDRNGKIKSGTAEVDPGRLKRIDVVKNKTAGQNDSSLVSRVILSLKTDSLEMNEFNKFLQEEIRAREIEVEHAFTFQSKGGGVQKYNAGFLPKATYSTTARSPYLSEGSSLRLYYGDLTESVLKKNFLGLFLSGLLITAVVACLFFLLKIISRQKQLSELREDLISNITHEFKTPISTVKVALEGIENFSGRDDLQKRQNYLQVANNHLEKLEFMVDKLLETATLKDNLQLDFERVELVAQLDELVQNHRKLAPEKSLCMSSEVNQLYITSDAFHLSNAINNVLDNAVKYGGNEIEVKLGTNKGLVEITVGDNGKDLAAAHAAHIFEKFYRVPKGNVHNVKGFGIGLYYTKQIVEGHGGTIEVVANGATQVIIRLPNG